MIKLGIIGAGPNAAGHAAYFQNSGRAQVAYIADPATDRAIPLAESVGAKAIVDYREFLPNVDAVIVSSPNFLHREHAVTSAQAGCHVYCEKPMGLSFADAHAIADTIKRANVKSTVGFAVRFSHTIQTMQRYLNEGKLGPLVSLCSRRLFYLDPATRTSWRNDPALSGGLLMEINIHEIEWMMALGGPVESVYARRWTTMPEKPMANDQIWVTLNFANGAVGSHEGSWLSSNAQFYRNIQGTDAGIATDEWGSTLYHSHHEDARTTIQPDRAFDIQGHFLDCIEHGAMPVADAAWGLEVMRVAQAIMDSAAQHKQIDIAKYTVV